MESHYLRATNFEKLQVMHSIDTNLTIRLKHFYAVLEQQAGHGLRLFR